MTISFVSSAEGANIDGGNVTLTLTDVQENDVTYIWGGYTRNSGLIGPAAGENYADLGNVGGADSNDCRCNLSRIVHGASPDTSVICQGGGNASDGVAYIAITLRGVDTTTPEDATPTTATGAGNTQPDSPSIDTVTDGAFVISFVAQSVSDTAVTAPTGYINQVDINGNDSTELTAAGATKLIALAGTENPAGWTNFSNAQAGATALWAAVTVAVRPSVVDNITVNPTGMTMTMGQSTPTVQAGANITLTPTGLSMAMSLGVADVVTESGGNSKSLRYNFNHESLMVNWF